MRKVLAVVLMMGMAQMGFARERAMDNGQWTMDNVGSDSVKMEQLNEVVVKAVKAPANAP